MAIDVIANMKARVGRQLRSDGDDVIPWAGRQANLITQPFGKYYQAALDGYLFWAASLDAGVTALQNYNGTTAEYALYNPNGTGVNLVLLQVQFSILSGTFVDGPVTLMANTAPASAATTGAALAVVNAKISGGAGVGTPLSTATLPEVPSFMRELFHIHLNDGTSTDAREHQEADIDGAIIVPPGCCISIISQMAGAGTSPLVRHSMLWAEVPA